MLARFETRSTGVAYLLPGPLSGSASLSSADGIFAGEDGYLDDDHLSDYAGGSVALAGDIDDDGYDDMLIGSGNGAGGAIYVLYSPASGSFTLAAADAKLEAEGESEAVSEVAGAGDVNADGFTDILVGGMSIGVEGGAYLVLGPVSGTMNLADANGKFSGESRLDHAGRSVAGAGDVDADGYADFLIGASSYDTATDASVGAAYLIYGGP